MSTWVDRFLGRPTSAAPPEADTFPDEDRAEPQPEPDEDETPLVAIQVALPPDVKILPDVAEHFLLSLSACTGPVSFELVGATEGITLQLACRTRDAAHVREQLRAYFPEATLSEDADVLAGQWRVSTAGGPIVVDFGLSEEFMRPLRTFARFEADPLMGVTGALTDLQPGELGLLQILFTATRAPWAASILRSATDGAGGAFFADAPEMLPFARVKVSRPLYVAVIRIAAQSPDPERAWQLAKRLGGALAQVASPPSNELIPLTNDDYPDQDHAADVVQRRTHRSGLLVNSEELVALVHLPSATVRTPKLKREHRRTKEAPPVARGHRLRLGDNVHGGVTQPVTLSQEHRLRHTHVIGASGTGKSTLLLNLILQDMEHGEGLAVLDPHGDLIDQILGYVPEQRHEDVILIDPADAGYPVGFNILSAHSELEKTLLSSDLVAVFRRLSTSWGDQMTSVLGNAVLAFLESDRGGTLADLRRFLVEADFRRAFLETVRDEEVVYYWQREFPLLTGRPQAPLLTRLDTFLRPKLIRAMVAQPANRVDFAALMNDGKILLVKLAQGAIGGENAALLGTLFVAKFNQLALGRQAVSERERRPFFVYVDEFQHFVTPSMGTLLSGARKYRLGLILAHQELRQLWNQDRDVAAAVLANPATRICFRVGDDDAKKLEDGFASFTARDLQNLGVGEAICRIDRADSDFSLSTHPLPPLDPALARTRREALVALSRARYGTPPEPARRAPEPRPMAPRPEPQVDTAPRPVAARAPKTPRPPAAPTPPRAQPVAPAPLGRGGSQHKYLQELAKRWAEDRGYRTTIEKPILDGLGSVDVVLEKQGHAIACEISVTTSVEQEFGNVQKCLAAGFEHVVAVAVDSGTARRLTAHIRAQLEPAQAERVSVLTPEDFVAWLDTQETPPGPVEHTVRGYRVTVRPSAGTAAETKLRKQAIAGTILQALRRLKKGP